MDNSPVVLIFASSGVGLREITDKLKRGLGDKVFVGDIEKKLCQDPEIASSLISKGLIKYSETPTMLKIVGYLPKKKVIEYWKKAISSVFNEFRTSDKPVSIITGHALYYNKNYREFYSPIDLSEIRKSCKNFSLYIKRIALLTDDFPDMFNRLSKDGNLFDTNSLRSYKDKVAERDITLDPKFIDLTWKKDALELIFHWRYTELILLDNQTMELGGDFMLWGVKNNFNSFQKWITEDVNAIYLSHPISDVRRNKGTRANKKKWPSIVEEEINKIPTTFKDIAIVMPTAIDELRFEPFQGHPSGNLADRWPLLSNNEAIFTDSSNINYSDFLSKNVLGMNQELEMQLSIITYDLRNTVELQVSARDHMLVHHAKGIIVYRPFWNKSEAAFSEGVRSEIVQWSRKDSSYDRAVFIHFKDEVKRIICNQKDDFFDQVKKTMQQMIYQETNIDSEPLDKIMDVFFLEKHKTNKGILENEIDSEIYKKVGEKWDGWYLESINYVLLMRFTYPNSSPDRQMCVVVENYDELVRKSKSIMDFLNGKSNKTKKFEKTYVNLVKTQIDVVRESRKVPNQNVH